MGLLRATTILSSPAGHAASLIRGQMLATAADTGHSNYHICVRAACPSGQARRSAGAGAGCSAITYQSLAISLRAHSRYPHTLCRCLCPLSGADAPLHLVTEGTRSLPAESWGPNGAGGAVVRRLLLLQSTKMSQRVARVSVNLSPKKSEPSRKVPSVWGARPRSACRACRQGPWRQARSAPGARCPRRRSLASSPPAGGRPAPCVNSTCSHRPRKVRTRELALPCAAQII